MRLIKGKLYLIFFLYISPALKTMILGTMPKYLEAIKIEVDRTTVMAAVDSIQEMLAKIGEPVLSITGATDAILTAVKEIFTHKVNHYQ